MKTPLKEANEIIRELLPITPENGCSYCAPGEKPPETGFHLEGDSEICLWTRKYERALKWLGILQKD